MNTVALVKSSVVEGKQKKTGNSEGKERTSEEVKKEEIYCHLFVALPPYLSCQPHCPLS